MTHRQLTPKQALFVTEYLIDLNSTKAAIRAGYSAKTADKIGPQLLGKTSIKNSIDAAIHERANKTQITADYVLTGIRRITEAAEADGKRSEALRGYELMGKHLKLFTDKSEITGANGSDLIANGVLLVPATKNLADWEKDHCKK